MNRRLSSPIIIGKWKNRTHLLSPVTLSPSCHIHPHEIMIAHKLDLLLSNIHPSNILQFSSSSSIVLILFRSWFDFEPYFLLSKITFIIHGLHAFYTLHTTHNLFHASRTSQTAQPHINYEFIVYWNHSFWSVSLFLSLSLPTPYITTRIHMHSPNRNHLARPNISSHTNTRPLCHQMWMNHVKPLLKHRPTRLECTSIKKNKHTHTHAEIINNIQIY